MAVADRTCSGIVADGSGVGDAGTSVGTRVAVGGGSVGDGASVTVGTDVSVGASVGNGVRVGVGGSVSVGVAVQVMVGARAVEVGHCKVAVAVDEAAAVLVRVGV